MPIRVRKKRWKHDAVFFPIQKFENQTNSFLVIKMNSSWDVENLETLNSPAILVWPDRITANLRRMIDAVGDVNLLRPHVKTHKMAEVIAIKRGLGIERFKASTIAEAEMTAMAGGKDILLAYPIVGPNIDRFLKLKHRYRETKFTAIVDDRKIARQISSQASAASSTVALMADINIGMGRTGVLPNESAVELYRDLCSLPGIFPAGLHAYDGHLHELSGDPLDDAVEKTFLPLWQLRDRLESRSLPVPNIVAGGTPTSIVLARRYGIQVGAGTIALWDSGQDGLSPDMPFEPAAVIMTRIISRPASNRLCLDLGHKAIASEMTPPRIQFLTLPDATQVMHSEEHMVIETSHASSFDIGDVLLGIPTHICPTIALHQQVGVVRNGQVNEYWNVLARNRTITI
jgi:D-threonine aldolase